MPRSSSKSAATSTSSATASRRPDSALARSSSSLTRDSRSWALARTNATCSACSLVGAPGRVRQQSAETEDRVDRRAQLVADAAEEPALRLARAAARSCRRSRRRARPRPDWSAPAPPTARCTTPSRPGWSLRARGSRPRASTSGRGPRRAWRSAHGSALSARPWVLGRQRGELVPDLLEPGDGPVDRGTEPLAQGDTGACRLRHGRDPVDEPLGGRDARGPSGWVRDADDIMRLVGRFDAEARAPRPSPRRRAPPR